MLSKSSTPSEIDERELSKELVQTLQSIGNLGILKDLYRFFEGYRSHFYQRKSWYDARHSTFQNILVISLSSTAAALGILFQQKVIVATPAAWLLYIGFGIGALLLIVLFVVLVFDLLPRSEFEELREPELLAGARVQFVKNYYRKQIAVLALYSIVNGLRIEKRYRFLGRLLQGYLIAVLILLLSIVGLFGLLPERKSVDYTKNPAIVKLVDDRSLGSRQDRLESELRSLRNKVERLETRRER